MDANLKLDITMGLEDFTSGVTDSGSQSSSRNANRSSKSSKTANKPSNAEHCFTNDDSIAPRAIEYQIHTFGVVWTRQFSRDRIDEGEIVFYTTDKRATDNGSGLVVFTTILSNFDNPQGVDQHDIKIVEWDMENNEPIGEPVFISPEGEWDSELLSVIMDRLKWD